MPILSNAVAKVVIIISLVFTLVFGILWLITENGISEIIFFISIGVEIYALRELYLNKEANGE